MAEVDFWQNKFWHHRVHERLGEVLSYYLIRVRPLDDHEVVDRIGTYLKDKHLGSVRVFPIFGTYDFIVRAWLHPHYSSHFREWLHKHVGESGHGVNYFTVDHIYKRWYLRDQEIDRNQLEGIDEDEIRKAQAGIDKQLLRRLRSGQLVIVRRKVKPRAITFFVAINHDLNVPSAHEEMVDEMNKYLQRNKRIKNASIYGGVGVCSLLFKGEVDDYFDIAKFPNWITEYFRAFNASTETYLVRSQASVLGNESIGEATFAGLKGRNLFVQAILPELYQDHTPKRSTVEQFLVDEVQMKQRSLAQKDKKLLHDYLLGYIRDDSTQMAKTLFTLFYEMEKYLRDNHGNFIGRKTQRPIKEMYKEAGIQLDKPLTLGDILRLYSLTIRKTDKRAKHSELTKDWGDLAELRNGVAHGRLDYLAGWKDSLRTLLENLPRIRLLLLLVESFTDKPYSAYY